MKWETPTTKREPASVSICRLPWKMEKTMADGEKDEAERGKHRRRRKGDRDIPGDEREGSPPKKMLCDWSPPEVEYSVAVSGRVSFWSFSSNFCLPSIGTRVLL